MYWDHMGSWGSGWAWMCGALFTAALVGIGAVVAWLAFRTGSRSEPSNDRARDVLAERYARGEITTDEYRERVDALH